MPKVEWSNELSVNVAVFDNEHKKLVDILNKLYDAMSQGQGQQAMATVLVELADYTKTHFAHEENAMEKYGYPGLTEQKKAHELFVNKLNETQTQYNSGSVTISVNMFNFLFSWIENHIKKMDSGYSEFFNKLGVQAL